jgi:cytochrome c oxidase assembly factor CtaG
MLQDLSEGDSRLKTFFQFLPGFLALLSLFFVYTGPLHFAANYISITARMVETLFLTIWVAPLFWLSCPPSGSENLVWKALAQPWLAALGGNLLVVIWFWPFLQRWDSQTWGGDLLAFALSCLGGLWIWAPLLGPRRLASAPQQLMYLLVQIACHLPLFFFLTSASAPLYDFGGINWGGLNCSPFEDQQLAGWTYKLCWTSLILVLTGKVFLEWGRLRQVQDQLENTQMYEHLALLKRSETRFG